MSSIWQSWWPQILLKDGFGGDFPPCREIAQIKGEIEEALRDKITINDLLEPAILKPFLIAITMYAILNLSGLNIMIFYCNPIFQYSGSSLNHNVASIIVAILLLISSFLAIIVIKVLPRKIILITSIVGMSICYLILGGCFHQLEKGRSSPFSRQSTYPLLFVILVIPRMEDISPQCKCNQ